MNNFYARTVFFVADGERSQTFYTERLGFSRDWGYDSDGRAWVFQVSLFGFELIINQVDQRTQGRAGHGRVFIGLDDDQLQPLLAHLASKRIPVRRVDWGRPTLLISDPDGNELFFWLASDDDWSSLELPTLES
ncbi:MAG TPA: VOC family protein [Gemmatimonadales bacterium]|nr:VOC family protein [Gemmatimonadales bacterium]